MPVPIVAVAAAGLIPGIINFLKKHPWIIPIAIVVPLIAGFLIFSIIAGSLAGLQNIRLPGGQAFCNVIAATQPTPTPTASQPQVSKPITGKGSNPTVGQTSSPSTNSGKVSAPSVSATQDTIPPSLGFRGILQQCVPVYGNGTWGPPLKTWIASPFYGMRITPGGSSFTMHEGIDLAAPQGEPLIAAAAGTVTFVQNNNSSYGYGNYVIIDNGNGISTLYAHIMPGGVHVAVGDIVQTGQEIAQVGQTGDATGPHVHFEVRKGNKQIDPMIFLMSQGVDLSGSRGILWSYVYAPTGLAYCTDMVYPWKFCSHFGL